MLTPNDELFFYVWAFLFVLSLVGLATLERPAPAPNGVCPSCQKALTASHEESQDGPGRK